MKTSTGASVISAGARRRLPMFVTGHEKENRCRTHDRHRLEGEENPSPSLLIVVLVEGHRIFETPPDVTKRDKHAESRAERPHQARIELSELDERDQQPDAQQERAKGDQIGHRH
jgi:hypothetical protein